MTSSGSLHRAAWRARRAAGCWPGGAGRGSASSAELLGGFPGRMRPELSGRRWRLRPLGPGTGRSPGCWAVRRRRCVAGCGRSRPGRSWCGRRSPRWPPGVVTDPPLQGPAGSRPGDAVAAVAAAAAAALLAAALLRTGLTDPSGAPLHYTLHDFRSGGAGLREVDGRYLRGSSQVDRVMSHAGRSLPGRLGR